jgi:hypothetical protein
MKKIMSLIRCNNCKTVPLLGTTFRTSCKHFICEECANQAFSTDCFCPVCGDKLQARDVHEMIVGVPPLSLHDNMYQVAFQEANWKSVAAHTNEALFTIFF